MKCGEDGNCHATNPIICVACQAHYCLTCHHGCPTCGFGRGLDRRAEARASAQVPMRLKTTEEP